MWCSQAFSFIVFDNIKQLKMNFSYLLLHLLNQSMFFCLGLNATLNIKGAYYKLFPVIFKIRHFYFSPSPGEMQNQPENIAFYKI